MIQPKFVCYGCCLIALSLLTFANYYLTWREIVNKSSPATDQHHHQQQQQQLRFNSPVESISLTNKHQLSSFETSKSYNIFNVNKIQTTTSKFNYHDPDNNNKNNNDNNNNNQLKYQQLLAEQWEMKNILSEQTNLIENQLKILQSQQENSTKTIRSVIITTWRSGSTFLGDILNAMDGNFYHYEPLLPYKIIQIRGPPNDRQAIKHLIKLLNCNYTEIDENYLITAKNTELFHQNTHFWRKCGRFCFNLEFLQSFCLLFPMQSMKVVRLRLELAKEILSDESLNVHLLYLIRDPRAILQSRRWRPWCRLSNDCANAKILCDDLLADFETAQNLTIQFPTRFKILHYEELALRPYETTKTILKFFKRSYTNEVKQFLDEHTKKNYRNLENTFRKSKTIPTSWIHKMKYREIDNIQMKCEKTLEKWQYKKITSPENRMKVKTNNFYKFFYNNIDELS